MRLDRFARPSERGDAGVMLADSRRALAWTGLLLLASAVICALVWSTVARSAVQWADDRVLRVMELSRSSPLTGTAKVLAFIGGVWCTWVLRGAVVAALAVRREWLHLTAFLLAVATSEPLIRILNGLYDRPRPAGSLIGDLGSSFPSGHAVAAAVTAVGIVIVLFPPAHTGWPWERRAVAYTSIMALSPSYLGAHWLSDVVAGGLLGSAIAIGWPAVLVLWRARR